MTREEEAAEIRKDWKPGRPWLVGFDDDGSYVWELPNGRWTFAETGDEALTMRRTFEPGRYVGKYGMNTLSHIPAAGQEPTATKALETMLSVLNGWIQGARENHEAMGRRDSFDAVFHAVDIGNMVQDVASELGLPRILVPQVIEAGEIKI